jgi:dihydroceramidase
MKNLGFFIKPTLAALSVCSLVIVLLLSSSTLWQNWQPASCLPFGCFCEALYQGAIKQPMNTWSGLSFVIVGFWVLGCAWQDRWLSRTARSPIQNPMRQSLIYANLYAAVLIITSFGTSFYHATLTFVGQFFDVMGMYLIATFILLYNLRRLVPNYFTEKISEVWLALTYVFGNSFLGILLVAFPELRRWVFAALLLAGLTLEILIYYRSQFHIKKIYLIWALIVFGLGFLLWFSDKSKLFCAPTSWLQGHALWQILGALSAGLLYLYYRSERRDNLPV